VGRLAVRLVLLGSLSGFAGPAGAQATDGSNGDPQRLIAQWQANDTACRNPATPAIDAVGACEQRDLFAKLLALQRYCHASAAWAPCAGAASGARTSARFHRMGGVFVLPASLNGSSSVYFIVDSGAANVQIPEDVAEEMKRSGSLADADFLGQRRFVLADGSGVQQRIFRLRTLKIGDRTMDNVLAALGAPRSRPLLGQSFLRRLNWWKIDNVQNAIELEFAGAF
jgi:predicted aspartyl protease